MGNEPKMGRDELFDRCARMRNELADFVEPLTEGQLATRSQCGEWDVRTVVAHLTVLPGTSKLAFGAEMLRARGNMDRAIDTLSRRAAARPAPEIAARLRELATSRAVPPMLGPRAPFADLLVHTADARLPLGLPWSPPVGDAAVALGFLARAPIGFFPRGRLSGIRLVATDVDYAWRTGAELRGTAAQLLRAVCGRPGAVEDVSGPGRELLATRV